MDATAWTFAKWGSSLNWFWNSNYTVFQQSHLLLNFHSDLICPYRIGWKCHKRWNWTKSVCNYLRAPIFSISLSSKIKYNYFHFKQFCFLHLFWILGYRLCPSFSTSQSCTCPWLVGLSFEVKHMSFFSCSILDLVLEQPFYAKTFKLFPRWFVTSCPKCITDFRSIWFFL